MVLLTYALRRKLGKLEMSDVARALLILVPTAIFAGAVAWELERLWEHHWGHATLLLKLGSVFGPGTVAVLVYWAFAFWANVPAAREMAGLILQKLVNKR